MGLSLQMSPRLRCALECGVCLRLWRDDYEDEVEVALCGVAGGYAACPNCRQPVEDAKSQRDHAWRRRWRWAMANLREGRPVDDGLDALAPPWGDST